MVSTGRDRNYFAFGFISFIAAIAVLPTVFQLQPGHIFARGDLFPIWLNAHDALTRDVYLWQSSDGSGPAFFPSSLLTGFFWWSGQVARLPSNVIQVTQNAMLYILTGFGTFLLGLSLFQGRFRAALSAAVFNMFNMTRLWNIFDSPIWLSALFPWLLWLLLSYFQAAQTKPFIFSIPHALSFAFVASVTISLGAVNIPQVIVIMIGLFVVAAIKTIHLLIIKRSLSRVVLIVTVLMGVTGALSSWWFATTANYYFLFSEGRQVLTASNPQEWAWTSARSTFVNQFWLNPIWAWRPNETQSAYWAFMNIYTNLPLQIIVFLPASLGMSALLFIQNLRERRFALILVGTLLTLMFLGKGLREPLSTINLFLYDNIPWLWLLREPWPKLSIFIVLILSLLIGLATEALFRALETRISRRWLVWPTFLGGLLVFPVIVFPLFLPDVLYGSTALWVSASVRIPSYWNSAAIELRRDQPTKRVLMLPDSTYYAVPYTWGGYVADWIPSRLLPLPVLERPLGYLLFNQPYEAIIDHVYASLETADASLLPVNTLALLNARYILVRNDVADRSVLPLGSPVPDPRLPIIHQRLQSLPGVALEQRIGELDLYRIGDAYFLPHFYVPTQTRPLASPAELVQQTDSAEPIGRTAFLAPEDLLRRSLAAGQTPPAILFERTNPTKYRVRVRSASVPFLLVFSEGYHPGWKAYRASTSASTPPVVASYFNGQVQEAAARTVFFDSHTPETWLRSPLPEERHLQVNGYANGWWLTEAGDYDLIIEYWPQRLFYWGLAISGLTLVGSVGFLLLRRRSLRATSAPLPALPASEGPALQPDKEREGWDDGPFGPWYRRAVLGGLALLSLAAIALASGHEAQAEGLANWAYFLFVAAVVQAGLKSYPPWRRLTALLLPPMLMQIRGLGIVVGLALSLGLAVYAQAPWLTDITAVALVLFALGRIWALRNTQGRKSSPSS